MTQQNIFDDWSLKLNLKKAIAMNCIVEMRDGVAHFRFQNLSAIKIFPQPREIRELAARLSEIAPLAAVVDINTLPNLMLEAAIFASCTELVVIGSSADPKQIGILKRKIAIDFALVCSLALASAHGYEIREDTLQWEVMRSVLMVKDDDSLVRLFRDALSSHVLNHSEPRNSAPISKGDDRALSSESYWNLVSMADVENWPDAVVVGLISEYLSITTRPDLVHYSNSLSGDEWRRMYERIYGLLERA